MPIMPQRAEELVDVLRAHTFRVLLLVKNDKTLYPVNIGFFGLVGITLVPQTALKTMDKPL